MRAANSWLEHNPYHPAGTVPMRHNAIAVLLPLLLLGNDPVEIKEWPVPFGGHPRDPYVDQAGKVWFVGQRGHYVAYLEPKTGEFRKFDLEPGAGPHNVVVDRDGTPWYTGNLKGYIAKLNPRTGEITRYPMPDSAARDPHTLVFDARGDMWFTVQNGNFVGHIERSAGKTHLIKVPTPRSRPYGIILDSKGRVWFNEFNTNKLGMVDPATMQLQEFMQPRPETRGRRIERTSDDRIWYVDYAAGYLGVFDPRTNQFREWMMPSGAGSRPYAMAVDDRDRVWAVESGVQPNQFVGFDPKTEKFFSVTKIPSGGGTVRHMVFHKPTREIWFGTDAGTIGRAKLP